jgi:hypothetical protein
MANKRAISRPILRGEKSFHSQQAQRRLHNGIQKLYNAAYKKGIISSVGVEPTTLGLLDPRSNQLSYEDFSLIKRSIKKYKINNYFIKHTSYKNCDCPT